MQQGATRQHSATRVLVTDTLLCGVTRATACVCPYVLQRGARWVGGLVAFIDSYSYYFYLQFRIADVLVIVVVVALLGTDACSPALMEVRAVQVYCGCVFGVEVYVCVFKVCLALPYRRKCSLLELVLLLGFKICIFSFLVFFFFFFGTIFFLFFFFNFFFFLYCPTQNL